MTLNQEQMNVAVDALIANEAASNPWKEGNREALLSMDEDTLLRLVANMEDDDDDGDDDDDDEDEHAEFYAKMKKGKKKKPSNNQATPLTTQQWLSDAPAEIRSAVQNAMAFEQGQKNQLIKVITANERNAFTKDYLANRDLEELQGLAALAATDNIAANSQQGGSIGAPILVPHYAGRGGPQLQVNEGFAEEDGDMFPEPFEWSKNS